MGGCTNASDKLEMVQQLVVVDEIVASDGFVAGRSIKLV
jgi:hypothetical protein